MSACDTKRTSVTSGEHACSTDTAKRCKDHSLCEAENKRRTSSPLNRAGCAVQLSQLAVRCGGRNSTRRPRREATAGGGLTCTMFASSATAVPITRCERAWPMRSCASACGGLGASATSGLSAALLSDRSRALSGAAERLVKRMPHAPALCWTIPSAEAASTSGCCASTAMSASTCMSWKEAESGVTAREPTTETTTSKFPRSERS